MKEEVKHRIKMLLTTPSFTRSSGDSLLGTRSVWKAAKDSVKFEIFVNFLR